MADFFWRNGLTGGGDNLDGIASATLTTGDSAIVSNDGSFYFYYYDSTDVTAESSPGVIEPDDGGGAWTLQSFVGVASSADKILVTDDDTGDTNCPLLFSADSTQGYKTVYEDSAVFLDNTTNTIHAKNFTIDVSGGQGGYNFYSDSYNAWQFYMANPGASKGHGQNLTAPSGVNVTSWALRSVIEPQSGYGWTWEEVDATADFTPTVVAELSSATGDFKTKGSVEAKKFNGTESTGVTPKFEIVWNDTEGSIDFNFL